MEKYQFLYFEVNFGFIIIYVKKLNLPTQASRLVLFYTILDDKIANF